MSKECADDNVHVVIEGGCPEVRGIPEGNVPLFFARINSEEGFCIVYGPENICKGDPKSKLLEARIAVGKDTLHMSVMPVEHGEWYQQGGGFVVAGNVCIICNPSGDCLYCGNPVEYVYWAI